MKNTEHRLGFNQEVFLKDLTPELTSWRSGKKKMRMMETGVIGR